MLRGREACGTSSVADRRTGRNGRLPRAEWARGRAERDYAWSFSIFAVLSAFCSSESGTYSACSAIASLFSM